MRRPWRPLRTCRHGVSSPWPSMKARALLRILRREPLSYRETRGRGSHRRLEADGYPPLLFSFHDGVEIGGTMVRRILVDQVGMDEATALDILRR